MTIAQQLRQEGREEGREEGSLLRLRAVVTKLLTLKFGKLDEPIEARTSTADEATLDRYTERVLSASTLGEVLQD